MTSLFPVMRLLRLLAACLPVALLSLACVDPAETAFNATVNVVVVDGTITNVSGAQTIQLNRSQADPFTGRFSTTPLGRAQVEIVVDSVRVVLFGETGVGRYEAPAGFVGQVGHAYQLRFTLPGGARYESDQQLMQPVPPIARLQARFNPNSLSPAQQLQGSYAAAHDFYVDINDPADQRNYYRWEWIDWERQEWCRTCNGGLYFVNDATGNLLENCVAINSGGPLTYDYNCRTTCWEIVNGNDLSLFSDQNTNGSRIAGRRVAQVPLYSKERCLIEIRQNSLTPAAYSYFKTLGDQTQRTGGIADTPPAAPIGNVGNRANPAEAVAGYFTASAVTSQRYWLTRSDAVGFAPGLFQGLNGGRNPVNEQSLVRDRPPLAVCVPSDTRTPVKPEGWRE